MWPALAVPLFGASSYLTRNRQWTSKATVLPYMSLASRLMNTQ